MTAASDLTRADLQARLAAMPLAERERLEMAVVGGIIETLKELRQGRLAARAAADHTEPEQAAKVAA